MLVLNLPFKALMFLTLMRPSLVLFLVLWLKLVKDFLKVRCRLALLPFLISCLICLDFFFSSRRRHTRWNCDWSSDVCSSDLGMGIEHVVTRTVRDCAALLDAVQGPGVGDPFVIAGPKRPYADEVGAPPGRLRIAVSLSGMMGVEASAATRAAVMKVAGHLESLGHHVEEASPVFDETMYHTANLTYWCGF